MAWTNDEQGRLNSRSQSPHSSYDGDDSNTKEEEDNVDLDVIDDDDNIFRTTSHRSSVWASLRTLITAGRSSRHMNPRRNYSNNRFGGIDSVDRPRRRRCCTPCRWIMLAIFCIIFFVFYGLFELLTSYRTRWRPFLPEWGSPGQLGEGLAHYPTDITRDVLPIPCHSHNDYWRRIPLLEAIHYGCTGVEADVWLIDGELLVGHDESSLTANRTFGNLYVKPLFRILEQQNPSTEFSNVTGQGVFDEDPAQTLVLLIDFKTSGEESFPFVQKQLEILRENNYLTYFDGHNIVERAVTVVGTGNAPFDLITSNSTYRDIFYDAPLGSADFTEDSEKYTPQNSYYASTSLMEQVGYLWRPMTDEQIAKIRSQVAVAHKIGLKARYWETPGWPVWLRHNVWEDLLNEGVDMLNVDDLDDAAKRDWKEDNGWF